MLKVTLAGCGNRQQLHADTLSGLEGVEIAGVCDPDASRAEEFAEVYGGRAFTDCVTMLDKTKPDAMVLAIPPDAHGAPEEAACARGVHMLIERPLGLDRGTVKRVSAAIRSAKVITSVCMPWRYYDTVNAARKALKGKAITLVHGWCHASLDETPWRLTMHGCGGQLHEKAACIPDLVRYLCGDVAAVGAIGSRGGLPLHGDDHIYDSTSVTLSTKSGAAGCITATVASPNGESTGLEIITTEATFRLELGVLTIVDGEKSVTYAPKNDPVADCHQAFLDAIRSGRASRIKCSYTDAAKTHALTLAANESIASGMLVRP